MLTSLADAGVSQSDARQWLSASLSGFAPEDVVEVALTWANSGLDIATRIEWADTLRFEPTDALKWHQQGYSPAEATFVLMLIQLGPRRLTFDECAANEIIWRASGLPTAHVCLALALGISDVADARHLHQQMEQDPALESSLRQTAADRGVSVRALKITDLEMLWASMC